jgi:hypothetical protein
MFSNSPIRRLKRQLSKGLVWAVLPLAFSGGMPTVSCACATCECGASCGLPGHPACGNAAASAGRKEGRCQCCNGHCDGKCCCCLKKQPSRQPQSVSPHDSTARLCSPPASRCVVSISAPAAAVTAATVGIDHHQTLSLDVPVTLDLPQAVVAVDHFDGFDTGPPVDLIVILRRFVI